jgi:hypothetical protein
MNTAIVALCFAVGFPGEEPDARSPLDPPAGWRYVVPAPGEPFEHAPFRAIVLVREKPEDVIEKVAYRGEPGRRRYARIRFGSPSSTRVVVVVDTTAAGEVDLYADADRNLKIDDRDRVPISNAAGRQRIWRLPLNVAIVEQDAVRTVPRAVVFRLGASGQTLGYAAAGFMEGKVKIGSVETAKADRDPFLTVRRVDGDGNGLLADAQDRLWIDVNRDGRFDPGSEQFLYASILNLDGSRYVVLSDELGTRLALEPLEGSGTLSLAFKGTGAASPVRAIDLHATAISRDGSVFGLTGSEPATVPAGEYRLGTLNLALDDSTTRQRWSFVFAAEGSRGQPRWYKVDRGAIVTIDPVGTPVFELILKDHKTTSCPGDDVSLQPALYTGDGLLIVAAYCGNPVSPAVQETLGARIALAGSDGHSLATAHSGFS